MILEITEREAKQLLFELEGAKDVIEEQLRTEQYENLEEYRVITNLIRKIQQL